MVKTEETSKSFQFIVFSFQFTVFRPESLQLTVCGFQVVGCGVGVQLLCWLGPRVTCRYAGNAYCVWVRQFLPLFICSALAFAAACTQGDSDSARAPKTTASTADIVARPPSPSDSACPKDGLWKDCALEDRINKSGMNIRIQDTVVVPYFSQAGIRYRIGSRPTMVAFFFADSAAGATATASLDRRRLTPPGDSIGVWSEVPVEVIRSSNLIAVLFGASATQAERIRLAVTAGAPQ